MKTSHILIGLGAIALIGGVWYFTKGKKTESTSGADGSCGCNGEKESSNATGKTIKKAGVINVDMGAAATR